jgi:coproporphyrinogen III oxidase-like Fe-S oxidoreductase
VRGYLDALLKELTVYASKPAIGGRKPKFVYFGGGTPSYLSPDQLKFLTDGMKRLLPWDEVEEVTFEAEPGTLTDHKLQAIRDLGVTRLSLGIEHFDDHIWRSTVARIVPRKSPAPTPSPATSVFRRSTLISSRAWWKRRKKNGGKPSPKPSRSNRTR